MRDIYNNQTPVNLNNLFRLSEDVHQYKTRSTSNKCIFIDRVETESSRRSFVFTGTKIWNSLPVSIKSLNKLKFKAKIKSSLLAILEKKDEFLNVDQIMNEIKAFH